jgi:tripartite ATP-independent transporter DctP family solute receptor
MSGYNGNVIGLVLLTTRAAIFVAVMGLSAQSCRAGTTLSLATIYAPEHPTAKACQYFAETLKTRSKGRITVNVYNDASMGNQTAIRQSLKNGSLDLSILSLGMMSTIVPEFNALGLPYLFPNAAAAWRVLDDEVGQLLVRKAAAKGLHLLAFWDIEVRHISNSLRPILKPADMAGLTIRTTPDPLTGEIITVLGGKTREVLYSELYGALKSGTVDGQENPLINFHTARLYEVQKFISLTAHKYSIYAFVMNSQAWESLSSGDKVSVVSAAREAARYQRALTQNAEAEAYLDLRARGVRINEVDTRPFIAATRKIYDKWYDSPIGAFLRMVVQKAQREE